MLSQTPALRALALGIIVTAGMGRTMAQPPIEVPVQDGTPIVQAFLQPENVQDLRNSQVLGIPTSHCGNVIDLMMTNRMRQQTNQIGTPEVYLPHLTVGTKTGDLELLCVKLVCAGDHCKGPIFQIGMKNNSAVPIGNFRVSVVGVLGRIHVHSPTMTVKIGRMECGEEQHIQVQLPVTCMSMHCATGQTVFDTLIVALDSYDELMECNELNNVQILKRGDIVALVTETVAPAPVPIEAVPVAPVPELPSDEGRSPLEDLNLENLDLGSDAASLLFRKR